jgi:predicted ribosome quality control (RQC) complex YloA/Tae2 family protein
VLGGTVEPTIARRGDEILGYAPYALRQFPDAETEHPASMSDVIAAVARHVPSRTPHDALRRPLFDALSDRLQALRRKRGNLERSLASADHADELRTAGEAILALAHDIAEGQTSISWEGQRIDLYPTLSPVENAQAYFRRYRSARDASRTVPPLLGEVEAELDYLEEMAVHVRLAQDQADLSAIRRELQERSILPAARGAKVLPQRRKPANAPTGPYRRFSLGDAQLLVGASARGNEVVTFRLAQPDDLWFHAHGLPGSHVVLRTGSAAHDRDVRRAAEVAAWHSSGKADGQVQVDYTHKKHVRRLPGAPGRVTYRNEKTMLVSPAPPPH